MHLFRLKFYTKGVYSAASLSTEGKDSGTNLKRYLKISSSYIIYNIIDNNEQFANVFNFNKLECSLLGT